MRKELIEFEAKGKTVRGFHYNWTGDMIITFTDNTFINFTISKDHFSEDTRIEQKSMSVEEWENNLVEAEVMTKEELTTWQDAKEQDRLRNKEERDKKEYERLEKEYESIKKEYESKKGQILTF